MPVNNSTDSIKIVQLSDLHSESFGFNQQILINTIRSLKPDLILLTGDIFEGFEKEELSRQNLVPLFKFLKVTAPFYYVTGNHEYVRNNQDLFKEIIRSNGGTVLEETSAYINIKGKNIILAGLDDPFKDNTLQISYDEHKDLYIKRIEKTAASAMNLALKENVENNCLKILMAHRPEYIKNYLQYDFDLIFSGHAHGGQWRFPPLINGLYASKQGIFPSYAGGRYTFKNKSVFIVNRGLTINHPKIPRIFNSPEAVCVTVEY